MDRLSGKPPRCVYAEIGVIAVNRHPQGRCRIGDQYANGAQPHNAQLLSQKLRPDELPFAFFHQFGHLGALSL